MTIASWVEKGDMIIVTVAGQSRTFVYPIDRFSTLAALEFEIDKSILYHERAMTKRTGRIDRLRGELNGRS